MHIVIKTDEPGKVQSLILERVEAGNKLSIVASKEGDLFRFQIHALDEDDGPTD